MDCLQEIEITTVGAAYNDHILYENHLIDSIDCIVCQRLKRSAIAVKIFHTF